MRISIQYIFIFIIISFNLYSIEKGNKIVWNDKEVNITTITINSIDYISIIELNNLIRGKLNLTDCTISLNKEQFKFSENSFYIVYSINDSLRVAQMTMPVINIDNSVLIPFYSLLTAFKGINLIDFNEAKNKISIKTYFFPSSNIHNYQNNTNAHLTNEIEKILVNDTINSEKVIQINIEEDSITNPKKYVIPKNLKK